MAGNQPASPHTENVSPQPDRGPPGRPQRNETSAGYAEPNPTRVETRDAPDPTIEGNQPAQTGTETPPQDPYEPDIDQPVPPGDIPSKTPITEPERGEAQYVDHDAASRPEGIYSDAASPVIPGPADGAD